MVDVPRRLPPSSEERLKVNLDRMAPGSATGFTRSARPVNPLTGSQARLPQRPQTTGRYAPLGYGPFLEDPIPGESLPVGTYAETDGVQSVAVGDTATAYETGVAVGYLSVAGTSIAPGGVAVGYASIVHGANAVSVGINSFADSEDAVAVGREATGFGVASVAVGPGASAQAYGVAIGNGALANLTDAVVIGRDAHNDNAGDFVLGTDVHTVVINTPLHTTAGAASGKYLPIRCGDGVIRLLPLYALP